MDIKIIWKSISGSDPPSLMPGQNSLARIHVNDMVAKNPTSISPLISSISIAGEGLEGVHVSEEGKAQLPHHRIEELVLSRLKEGGHLEEWETEVETLDSAGGLNRLSDMKVWTDQLVMSTDRIQSDIAYQFDGNKLLPIRLDNPCSFRSNVITVDQI